MGWERVYVARAAGMSPASPDLTERKSPAEIKEPGPRSGISRSGPKAQPLLGHRQPDAALHVPLGGTVLAQELFHQAQFRVTHGLSLVGGLAEHHGL